MASVTFRHVSSKGKENELPPATTTATATVKKCKKSALRRCGSLSSNNEQRSDLAGPTGRRGSAIAETLSSLKASFQVHCDDKNEQQPKPQPQVRPRRDCITTSKPRAPLRDNGDKKPAPGVQGTGEKLSRKRLSTDQSRKNKNELPSKIPRRVRSISSGTGEQKPRSCGYENAVPRRRAISTARSSSRDVKRITTPKIEMQDRMYCVASAKRLATSNTVQRDGLNRRLDSNDLRKLHRKDHRRDVSPSTPLRMQTPRAFDHDLCKTSEEQAPVAASKAQLTSSSLTRLFWNMTYHCDLLMVELEKEKREPQLSTNFLRKHVNAEQRTLIVTFLLRLGTHNGYSSHIIYRAVKLFDAATDRLQLETPLIQLVALASMWIALKTLGCILKHPKASTMIDLAKGLYAGREELLTRYERKILRILDFNVTFADVHSLFGYHLINSKHCTSLSKETFALVYGAGGYAIDVTLLDERFCRMPASLVAIATAELVFGLVVDTEQARAAVRLTEIRPRWLFWRGLLFAATSNDGFRIGDRFQHEEIDRCRVMMLRCILNSGDKNSRFAVVWKKYTRSKYDRIAESIIERASMLSAVESFDS